MALLPVIYDVISCNQGNWLSPNLRQNMSKEYAHSYWKRQMEMINRLGKIQEKPYATPFVRPRVKDNAIFLDELQDLSSWVPPSR